MGGCEGVRIMQNILERIDQVLQSYMATSVVSFDLIQKEHPDIQQILKLFWMNQYNIGFYQDVVRHLIREFINNQKVIIDNQNKILMCKKKKKIKKKKNVKELE